VSLGIDLASTLERKVVRSHTSSALTFGLPLETSSAGYPSHFSMCRCSLNVAQPFNCERFHSLSRTVSSARYRHGWARLRPLETVIWPVSAYVSDIHCCNVTSPLVNFLLSVPCRSDIKLNANVMWPVLLPCCHCALVVTMWPSRAGSSLVLAALTLLHIDDRDLRTASIIFKEWLPVLLYVANRQAVTFHRFQNPYLTDAQLTRQRSRFASPATSRGNS